MDADAQWTPGHDISPLALAGGAENGLVQGKQFLNQGEPTLRNYLLHNFRHVTNYCTNFQNSHSKSVGVRKQEGHDGPVSLHWLICETPSYQTLQYFGIGLKRKTPNKD